MCGCRHSGERMIYGRNFVTDKSQLMKNVVIDGRRGMIIITMTLNINGAEASVFRLVRL